MPEQGRLRFFGVASGVGIGEGRVGGRVGIYSGAYDSEFGTKSNTNPMKNRTYLPGQPSIQFDRRSVLPILLLTLSPSLPGLFGGGGAFGGECGATWSLGARAQ
jgi:hypothetical protein